MLSTISNQFQSIIGYFRPSAANGSTADRADHRTTPTCYRYTPNNEQHYFADNFILGSEKFETLQPEAFLFGDNADLNFLNPEPLQVPFNLSMELSPVYPIRSLIHVRRDTIRLVRNPSAPQSYRVEFFFDCDIPVEVSVRCLVRESFLGNGGGQLGMLGYSPISEQFSTVSPSYRFPSGGAQLFSKADWSFTPADWPQDSWVLTADANSTTLAVPIVVRCRTITSSDGNQFQSQRRIQQQNSQQQQQNQQIPQQEHIVLIGLEKSAGDGSFHLKNVRQKLVDNGSGCVFLLHELYGAENKSMNTAPVPAPPATVNKVDEVSSTTATNEGQGSSGDISLTEISGQPAPAAAPIAAPAPIDDAASDLDDSAGECVVCMSSERDTVLLPCRHLCVCATCAESLRSQCADCPICRLPFKALLRLRAVRPADSTAAASTTALLSTSGIDPGFAMSDPKVMTGHSNQSNAGPSVAVDAIGENTPPGYSSVSLMEALYGAYAANWKLKSRPSTSSQIQPPAPTRPDSTSPLATASMATPKPTRQTPVFGRQISNADDGTNINNGGVNLAYNDDSNSQA